jgi:hypothetical protein
MVTETVRILHISSQAQTHTKGSEIWGSQSNDNEDYFLLGKFVQKLVKDVPGYTASNPRIWQSLYKKSIA